LARIRSLTVTLILALACSHVHAAWTGIAAFGGENRSDWIFGNTTLRAETFAYGLSIEERTRPGLRIGIAGGRFSLDLKSTPATQPVFEEFEGEFLQLYLRWPLALTEHFTLHTRFDYRLNRGDHERTDNDSEIEWSERSITAGIALRLGLVSLQPFIRYLSSDGDLDNITSAQSFELKTHRSHGLILDLHVEKTAYVRLRSEFSAVESLQVHFVRAF
jgi:hypothetical protein